MYSATPPAAGIGSSALNISIFAVFAVVTLVVVRQAGKGNRSAADYYSAGRTFTGAQNGVALAGDFLSAAAILGISGAIAFYGYDGFLYCIGALVGWLAALLVAEAIRNVGRFTMGDVLSLRLRERPIRAAAALSTVIVVLSYLFAQIGGAGVLVALLLNITSQAGQALVIIGVGILMTLYVLIGGMRGTTWVQIIKAGLLLVTTFVLMTWVLGREGFNFSAVLGAAIERNPHGEAILIPGLQYGGSSTSTLDFFSQAMAFVMGTAALPHVLMRYYTVPDAREARRSISWAIWLIGAFFTAAMVVGYAAGAMVDPATMASAPGKSNAATPLLAYRLGGEILLGIVSAAAFATILAVVAGLTIAASTSFAHDVYASIIKRGRAEPRKEIMVARVSALGIGVVGIAGGILAKDQNILFMVSLTFAVAASANLPTILYSLFWKRFSTAGALASIYTGLISSVTLIVLSPAVSGGKTSMLPNANFQHFPLSNPGIVTIPLSFLLGYVVSLLFPEKASQDRHAEMQVRALTGAGSEAVAQAADHLPEHGKFDEYDDDLEPRRDASARPEPVGALKAKAVPDAGEATELVFTVAEVEAIARRVTRESSASA
ncbi:cation acetate symporter [Pseudonocardia eucalypti]|uniref:Cation acetate symporter n=1 Tax=Pseudonocardia eucalypti TaxID=648755 RepID=A0ABP9PN57_9PSEU|nr:cation/acetate symporter [Pseudonocardia eucalypti]